MTDTNIVTGVRYTDPKLVRKIVRESDYPKPHQLPASGYGNKIPTSFWILYDKHWRRVYVICYGNSGSAYVIVKGQRMFLDTETECQRMLLRYLNLVQVRKENVQSRRKQNEIPR